MSQGYLHLADFRQKLAAFEIAFDTCRDLIPEHAALTIAARRSVLRAVLWAAHHAFDRGSAQDVDDLLAFAASVDPRVRRWPLWRRLQFKRLLGGRIVRYMESIRRLATEK